MTIRKTSLKLAASTAIFSMLGGLTAQIAHANHLNFTLYNESSKAIHNLYVAPARDRVWGQDLLGSSVLGSGAYMRVSPPGQTNESPCIFDIKVVFSDKTNSIGRYNLCETRSVTVRN